MIVRIWRAGATSDGAEKYQLHFEHNVLPELRSLSGFRKAYLLTRELNGSVDIEIHTQWESLAAVQAFAGPDLESAVVEPQARAALESYDRTVSHFTAIEYPA